MGIRTVVRLCIVALGAFVLMYTGSSLTAAGQTNGVPSSNGASIQSSNSAPVYEWDPTFPRPLPNNWLLGGVSGVAVDSRDHVWIVHRVRTAVGHPQSGCCVAAPAVIEFDQQGQVMQSWGGPRPEDFKKANAQPTSITPEMVTWVPAKNYTWPDTEYGISIDYQQNVWLGNLGGSHILKLNPRGGLLLSIGKVNVTNLGSHDTTALSGPTGIAVDPKTDEVYVGDGYVNRRVIVFDANTGAYKRHWGAYGKKPDDVIAVKVKPGGPPHSQFTTVRGIAIDKDDLVWVCDRGNSRVQIFKKDGTFVKEIFVPLPSPEAVGVIFSFFDGKGGQTMITPEGSVFDIALSRDPEQRFVFIADGIAERIWVLRRSDGKILDWFGYPGHQGGALLLTHSVAVDSKNNVYVAEAAGNRVQRFLYKGLRPLPQN